MISLSKQQFLFLEILCHLLCINNLYETSPKIPLAVEIIDIQIIGEPLVR